MEWPIIFPPLPKNNCLNPFPNCDIVFLIAPQWLFLQFHSEIWNQFSRADFCWKQRKAYTNLEDICKESWELVDPSIESCELKISPDGDKALDSTSQTDGCLMDDSFSLLLLCLGFAFTAAFALDCLGCVSFRTTPLFIICFFFLSTSCWLKVA